MGWVGLFWDVNKGCLGVLLRAVWKWVGYLRVGGAVLGVSGAV